MALNYEFISCTWANLKRAIDTKQPMLLIKVKLVAGLDLEHEVENGPPRKKRGRKKNLA